MTEVAWPRDPPGWVFAKRAVDLVGRAMLPGEWDGTEQHVVMPLPLTQADLGRPGSIWPIIRAMHARGVELPTGLLDRAIWRGTTLDPPKKPTPAEAALANRDVEERRNAAAPFFKRRNQVIDAILPWVESGRVQSALRDDATGLMEPVPTNLWNGDTHWLYQRFAVGRIDLRAPFSFATAGRWLFLDQAGLAKLEAFVGGTNEATWKPFPDQTLKLFVAPGGPAEAEARRRLKADGLLNPLEADVCARLADLWHEAGKTTGNGKSIATQRQLQRN